MKIASVVVNYGQWELTARCLESLRASRGVDVVTVLVDNASPGGIPGWAGDPVPGHVFLPLGDNLGFAGGCNAGFEESRRLGAELTFFLNNDAVVEPDTLRELALFMSETTDAGVVTPAVFFDGERDLVWSAGGLLNRWGANLRQKVFPTRSDLPDGPVETDFASGCAMMVRSGLFGRLGGFREDYFMYYEDAELCLRVQGEGYRVYLLPTASAYHRVGSSAGGEISPLSVYYSFRNRFFYSREALSLPMRAWFLLYYAGTLLKRIALYLLKMRRPELVPAIVRAAAHALTGRSGRRHPEARR